MADDAQQPFVNGAIGALITAIFGALIAGYKAIQRGRLQKQEIDQANDLKKQSQQFTEQGIIIDRQEKQIARLEAQVQEQQKAINRVQELHAECEVKAARRDAILAIVLDVLHKKGIPIDIPPVEVLDSKHEDAVDFIAKTTQTNTNLSSALNDKLREETEKLREATGK